MPPGERKAIVREFYPRKAGFRLTKIQPQRNYLCGMYQRYGNNHCTGHRINQDDIEAVVLQKIRDITAYVRENPNEFYELAAGSANEAAEKAMKQYEAEKDDIFIKPYSIRLLEWLQDMNWPGAFCIFYRLREYKDIDSLRNAVDICLKKAQDEKDDIWKHNLYLVLHEK